MSMKHRYKMLIVFVIVGITTILLLGQRKDTKEVFLEDTTNIGRGQALRSIALALTTREECEKLNVKYFSKEESSDWYVPYAEYLYQRGIVDSYTIAPTKQVMEGILHNEEMREMLRCLNLTQVSSKYLQGSEDGTVTETLFWKIYDEILQVYDRSKNVETLSIEVCGTPSNIENTTSWQVYTDKGVMGFYGLALDYYIDSKINVMARDNEIIRVLNLVDRNIIYENAWITNYEDNELNVFIDGVERKFRLQQPIDIKEEVMADISLENGVVKKVQLKEEVIQGKVLSVSDTAIEIEGYGVMELDEDFQIYKLYGGLERQTRDDILVGYAMQQFVVSNGKICGALTTTEFQPTKIRVLLKTTNYTSYFHDEVTLQFLSGGTIQWGDTIETYEENATVTIKKNDNRLQSGRMIITSKDNQGVNIQTIQRAQGTPTYTGTIEVNIQGNGITIINELPLEEYLTKVVPSEMPARYGIEAAKVQAICARSYAYKQIQANGCREYGAHVDDSTTYQVYNNIGAQEISTQGVEETLGEVLMYHGEVISTYYFSTSCGYTTDNSSWGANPISTPYLESKPVTVTNERKELSKEEQFEQFIKQTDSMAYEKNYTWYRWNYSIDMEALENIIETRLSQIQALNPESVLLENENGAITKADELFLGDLLSLEVTERGAGGIVNEILITGTKQKLRVRLQTSIRALLGAPNQIYNNLSEAGSSKSEGSQLPSGFFMLEEIYEDDILTGYTFYGGGNGHGIGMSQNGVDAMIQSGKTYKEVIEYFFNGTNIVSLLPIK